MPSQGEHFEARLAASRELTPTVRELAFERVDGRPMQYLAGQFFTVVLPERDADGPLQREYTPSAPADGTSRFPLMVTRVPGGTGSTWLHGAQPGVALSMAGPAGHFTRDPATAGPSLLVAAGAGLAPFRAMLFDAARGGHSAPLWLLLGVRAEADVPYREELTALCARHPSMRVELTLSRPGPGWHGRRGYVQSHVAELWGELVGAHPGARAYVAGLRKMVFAVRDLLHVDLAVDPKRLRIEAYD